MTLMLTKTKRINYEDGSEEDHDDHRKNIQTYKKQALDDKGGEREGGGGDIYNCCLTPSQPRRSYQGDGKREERQRHIERDWLLS